MSIQTDLQDRSESKCELCGTTSALQATFVAPHTSGSAEHAVLLCGTCSSQLLSTEEMDVHHWRCLNESMWSQTPAVQVVAWRMLERLKAESWAHDLSDMLYLDEPTLEWAQTGLSQNDQPDALIHKDSNGATLAAGDTVTLIKDLQVKGAGFTAKRGTAVRNITLVPDNDGHIEGRVNGQQIVILTEFVKKSG